MNANYQEVGNIAFRASRKKVQITGTLRRAVALKVSPAFVLAPVAPRSFAIPHPSEAATTNGVLLSNHHTPLISHTADDIITSLTGVYGDRHGQPVANSYNYFNPNASDGLGSTFASSFTYWTDPVDGSADPTYSLLTADGKNAPAPWVPFTRAGCNVGAASIANMELENVSSDLRTVFASDPTELAAGFNNQPIPDQQAIQRIQQAQALPNSVQDLANSP